MGDTAILGTDGPLVSPGSGGGGNGPTGPGIANTQGLRLSLSAVSPIPDVDILGSPTLYLWPYTSGAIALRIGATWELKTISAPVTIPINDRLDLIPVDVYAYWDGGAVAMQLENWLDATTRTVAGAQTFQDGVIVLLSDPSRRYMGTFLPREGEGTESSWITRLDLNGSDTSLRLDLWNYYNRVRIGFTMRDTGGDFVFTADAWQQWRANVNAQIELIAGFPFDYCALTGHTACMETASGDHPMLIGFGYNGAVAPDADNINNQRVTLADGGVSASLIKQSFSGYQFFTFMQRGSTANGTTTWLASEGFGFDGTWTC